MVPIAFLASNSGPGHAVPRASTDFATSTDFNSSAVMILIVKSPQTPEGGLKTKFIIDLNLNIVIFKSPFGGFGGFK